MLCPLRLDIDPLDLGSPPMVDTDQVKEHCRIDDTASDTLLDAYIRAAILWCENATMRTIARRAHRWVLAKFPETVSEAIRLPRGKTYAVDSVAYSYGGTVTTLTGPSSSPVGTGYQEDLRGDDGGVLMPTRGGSWPSTDDNVPAPVVITFQAGWTADNLPKDLLHAIYFCVADAFDLRGTPDFNPALLSSGGARLQARETLVSSYRLSRWY